jgi:hypothetical protein
MLNSQHVTTIMLKEIMLSLHAINNNNRFLTPSNSNFNLPYNNNLINDNSILTS